MLINSKKLSFDPKKLIPTNDAIVRWLKLLHPFSQFPAQKLIFIKVFNSRETHLVVTTHKFTLAQFVTDDIQVDSGNEC